MFTTIAYMNPKQSYCTFYDSVRHMSSHGFPKHTMLFQRAINVKETCMEWAKIQQQSVVYLMVFMLLCMLLT
jgi:hypothetical protein